jgi:site-specific recombinase
MLSSGIAEKAFDMDYVSLMFLAMAGLVVFLSCMFVSNWAKRRKDKHSYRQSSDFIPPMKRTISGNVQAKDAALELSDRMADWQRRHSGVKQPGVRVARQGSLRVASMSGEAESIVPRVH